MGFHNLEIKPQCCRSLERQNKFEDELIDDTECLGGLRQVGSLEPEKRFLIYSYSFSNTSRRFCAQAVDIAVMENAGIIVEINEDTCIVKINRGTSKESLPESMSIGPPRSIDNKIIRFTIYRFLSVKVTLEKHHCY